MMRNRKLTYQRWLIAAFAVMAVLFCVRAYDLEADPPPWGTVYYQPGDEGPYVTLAISAYNYGTINPDENIEGIDFWTAPSVKENLLENALVYAGLTLLGDNYYGLRFPCVVINLLNYILSFLILLHLQKKYGQGALKEYLMIGLAMLFLLVDYVFLVSSRVVEPTICRMLFIQIVILVYLHCGERSNAGYFTMGFLTVASIFLIYVSNMFLGLAFCILLIGIWRKDGLKAFRTAFFSYAGGCLAAFSISEMYYFICWRSEAVFNMLASVFGESGFLGSAGYDQASGVRGILKACVHMLAANSNLYNLPVLFLLLVTIPFYLRKIWTEHDNTQLFLFALPAALLIQTLFSNDYVIRKYLMIYPVSFYLIFIRLCSTEETWEPSHARLKKWWPAIRRLYIAACALACLVVPVFRLVLIHDDGTVRDFSLRDKLLILVVGGIAVVILAAALLYLEGKGDAVRKHFHKVLAASLFLGLFINVYMDAAYVVLNRTHGDKEAMEMIGQVVGDNYCLGYVSPGWTLYNDIKPIHNNYPSTVEMAEKDPSKYYFIDYTQVNDEGMRSYFDNIVFGSSQYTVREILSVNRDFQTFGLNRRLGIYEIAAK